MQKTATFPNPHPPYRLDLLPVVPPFYRKARKRPIERGELVYYGPAPSYYGIGEVLARTGRHMLVDFRGTGMFGVHEEVIEPHYLLPIPDDRKSML